MKREIRNYDEKMELVLLMREYGSYMALNAYYYAMDNKDRAQEYNDLMVSLFENIEQSIIEL